MKVLVTGGAGYIGSTIASALIDSGHTPVVLDDLSTGRTEFTLGRHLYVGDVADGALIRRVFSDHDDIGATIHCAAHIVVPDSMRRPLRYYRNNVSKTVSLLHHLTRHDCRRVLFSSSAAVYRPGPDLVVDETSPVDPTSPYARSKAMIDRILADCAAAGEITAVSLRYFNPVGADPLLRTGQQDPKPTHALGRLIDAWQSRLDFPVTGIDWPTRDGTGIRDYVHVWDLARAHVAAITRFDSVVADAPAGHTVINLGTGTGTTVRELVHAFATVVGEPPRTHDVDRRPGDCAGAYARSHRARTLLGWQPELTLADGIRHALLWHRHWSAPGAEFPRPDGITIGVTAGAPSA